MSAVVARRLTALLEIEPGEGRLVALMFACSFLLGSSVTLASTAAYTLFLSQLGAVRLSYAFIAIGLVVTSATLAYLRLSERLSLSRLAAAGVTLVLLVLAGAWLGLSLAGAVWLVFLLPVAAELANTLTSIVYWNLAGRLFTLQQGKRLFGLIGTGRELAKTAGGMIVPALVLWIGTPALLLVSAVCCACALALILVTTRSYAASLSTPSGEKTGSAAGSAAPSWWRNRYVLLILVIFVVAMMLWCTLDVVFCDRASATFGDEDRLASFLGLFFGFVGLLTLLGRGFFTARFLRSRGVRGGVLLSPALILGSTVVAVVVGSAFGLVVAFFWTVAAVRVFADVCFGAVDIPVYNILYQPLPAAQRLKVQALVEGVAGSLALGLSGVVLWALTALLRLGPVSLSYVVLALVIIWAAAAGLLVREYPHRLRRALATRRLGAAPRVLIDASTEAILRRELQSPSPGVVAYALTMLEAIGSDALAPCLPGLLDHPSPEVRMDALRRIERLEVTGAKTAIRRRLEREPDAAVCGSLLRTLAGLAGSDGLDRLMPHLDDPEPETRRGALTGLLRHGGADGESAATDTLRLMAGSSDPGLRLLAARVVGDAGAESQGELLQPLLQDRDPRVRRAALRAAGQLRSPLLWPQVVAGLSDPLCARKPFLR